MDEEGDGFGTVFRDVIMLALAGFVAMVLLLLPHLNPPGKAAEEEVRSPGSVIIEIFWPDELDADVDLWAQAPGERPVGYSNKASRTLNLLRDDLGKRGDLSERNYEVTYSRGIPAGEYTVNAHLYRSVDRIFPVPVKAIVSVKASEKVPAKQILAREVELQKQGEELTVFRFTLSSNGNLVPGSVHNLQKLLRSAPAGSY